MFFWKKNTQLATSHFYPTVPS